MSRDRGGHVTRNTVFALIIAGIVMLVIAHLPLPSDTTVTSNLPGDTPQIAGQPTRTLVPTTAHTLTSGPTIPKPTTTVARSSSANSAEKAQEEVIVIVGGRAYHLQPSPMVMLYIYLATAGTRG